MRDFTDYEIDITKNYGGANGNKIGIIIDGEHYLVKLPPVRQMNVASNDSYTEYLASNFSNILGYSAHQTELGTYKTAHDGVKTVVVCKDLTDSYHDPSLSITPFYNVLNSLFQDERAGKDTRFDTLMQAMDEQQLVGPEALKQWFADTFVLDAWLGNFDRHNGNWGLIIPKDQTPVICPRFDFGSCLFSRATEQTMRQVINSPAEREKRIFQYPTSAIKDMNGNKLNYYQFLTTTDNPYIQKSLSEFANRLQKNQTKLNQFLQESEIPDINKQFYAAILKDRSHKLIFHALDYQHEYLNMHTRA